MYNHILRIILLSFLYYFYCLNTHVKNNLFIRNDDKILLESICSKIGEEITFRHNFTITELTIYNNECHTFYDQYNFPSVDYDKKDIIYDNIWYESIKFGIKNYVLMYLFL